MFVALILVSFGIVLLLKNIGIITGSVWHILWPVFIIVFGLTIVFKQRRRKRWWDFFENRTKEDWEQWGKGLGQHFEEWGRRVERKYSEHPDDWENEIGRKIENKIKSYFERNFESKEESAYYDRTDKRKSGDA